MNPRRRFRTVLTVGYCGRRFGQFACAMWIVSCYRQIRCGSLGQSMRRLIASFVLCLTGWGPVSPLTISASGDPIPPCCRRDGKHHCMMMAMAAMGAEDHGSPRASTKPDPCPYRSLRATPTATSVFQDPPKTVYALDGRETIPASREIEHQSRGVFSIFSRGPPPSSSRSIS